MKTILKTFFCIYNIIKKIHAYPHTRTHVHTTPTYTDTRTHKHEHKTQNTKLKPKQKHKMPRVIRTGSKVETLIDADMTNLTVGMSIPLEENVWLDRALFTLVAEKEIVDFYNASLKNLDFKKPATVLRERCSFGDGHNFVTLKGLVMTKLLVPLKGEEDYVERFFINKAATLLACATSDDKDQINCIRNVVGKLPPFARLKKVHEVQRLKKFDTTAKKTLSEPFVKFWNAAQKTFGYKPEKNYEDQQFPEGDLNQLLEFHRWTKRSVDAFTCDFIKKVMPRVLKSCPELGEIDTFKDGELGTDPYAHEEEDYASGLLED